MANYCFDVDGTFKNSINGIYASLVYSLKKKQSENISQKKT